MENRDFNIQHKLASRITMYCELYKEDYTTLMGMDPADLKKLYLSLLIPIRIKLDYKFRNTNKKKGL